MVLNNPRASINLKMRLPSLPQTSTLININVGSASIEKRLSLGSASRHQGANPSQVFGAAAPKCKGLGAHSSRRRESAHPPRCRGSGGHSPRDAKSLRGSSPPGKSQFFITGRQGAKRLASPTPLDRWRRPSDARQQSADLFRASSVLGLQRQTF